MSKFARMVVVFIGLFNGLFGALAQDTTSPGRYVLGSGDQIRVIVYNEEDLSGEFELDGSGVIGLPLIGPVQIGGLDIPAAERLVSSYLADGYLINPRVNIEVLNYRPFYILGEVNQPGSYPYVNGMTILNAVALAGGFTHRASEKKVVIKRKDENGEEREIRVDLTNTVMPGDIIRVPERLF